MIDHKGTCNVLETGRCTCPDPAKELLDAIRQAAYDEGYADGRRDAEHGYGRGPGYG
jgi:hypothetical protein